MITTKHIPAALVLEAECRSTEWLSRRIWHEQARKRQRDFFRYHTCLEGYGNRTEVNYYVRTGTVARNRFVGVVVAKRAEKHQQL